MRAFCTHKIEKKKISKNINNQLANNKDLAETGNKISKIRQRVTYTLKKSENQVLAQQIFTKKKRKKKGYDKNLGKNNNEK